LFCVAADFNQLVALFVDKQLALDALEALTAQTPYAIMAISTRSSLKEKKSISIRILINKKKSTRYTEPSVSNLPC